MKFRSTSMLFVTGLLATAQTITTYAGNGTAGFSGDGGPATSAMINRVVGLAADAQGNLYLADENNHRVRKVDRNGVITTFAGTGAAGFSGDGGPAASAQLNQPLGVCVDTEGNVFINDNANRRIRKVTPAGTISTVFGNGSSAHSGDGGPATSAGAFIPIRCSTDRAGNLYFVDQGTHRVRKVTPGGVVTTIAGNGVAGFSGDGGPAASATLNNPTAISTDANDNLYVTDQANHRIRRIDTSGNISTVVFNGTNAFNGDGVPALSASSSNPGSTVVDSAGNIYIADSNAQRIRKVSGGTITTIAGTGVKGYAGDNGPALQANLDQPFAIAIDSSGALYIGDTLNNRVRKIASPAGGSPAITSAGVTNAASFQTGIVPGAIVTIFGTNLGARPGEIIAAPGLTWPTTLSGVSVTMDGAPAPVYRTLNLNGQEQVSVHAPFSLQGKTSVTVTVSTSGGSSTTVTVPVLNAQPGIFAGAVVRGTDNSVISDGNAVPRNEVIVIYMTGLGNVANAPPSGTATPSALFPTVISPVVSIGGFVAQISFSGLTPGYIGLYQINATVPAAVAAGAVDLKVEANGVVSNTYRLAVQ